MSQKLQYELSARDRTKAALRSFKKGLAGAGASNASALAFGGLNESADTVFNDTEEWTSPVTNTVTFTAS